MIQANELRLGNWLEYFIEDKYEGNEWVLNNVDEDDIVFCVLNNEQFNLSYRPIHITPKVLEKCGFEKSLSSYCYGIITNDYKNRITIFNDGRVKLNTEDLSLKAEYLHQLQNLYFALTGEELEYKP